MMIAADCSEGFLCIEDANEYVEGADGCWRTCREGEVLVPDFSAPDGEVKEKSTLLRRIIEL